MVVRLVFYRSLISKTRSFKDIHKGEEVYIIADSSDLRLIDFTNFSNKIIISFNLSYFIDNLLHSNNKIYAHLIESFYFSNNYSTDKGKLKLADEIKVLVKNKNITFFTNLTNIIYFFSLRKLVNFIYLYLPNDNFTKNQFDKNFPFTNWSILTAVSLAIYMGFNKAYIIGFSSHTEAYENHWYDNIPLNKRTYNMCNVLKSHTLRHEFFQNAQKHIKLVSLLAEKPDESYFEYELFETTRKYPLNPYKITTNHNILEMMKSERNGNY